VLQRWPREGEWAARGGHHAGDAPLTRPPHTRPLPHAHTHTPHPAQIWAVGADGVWACQFTIQPNVGALWRVSWAHPEFGCVLAVSGADQRVTVWEEAEAPDNAGRVVARWNKRAELGDARQSVNDVAFGPRHVGLKLATGSADGGVRVYEVTDTLNLTHWPLTEDIPRADDGAPVTCLSWCTSQFDATMLAVGGESGAVRVWGFSPAARKWLPMLHLARHGLPPAPPGLPGGPAPTRVHDVAWGPNVGRSYHLIASAGADGLLCLWKVVPENATDGGAAAAAARAGAGGGAVPAGDAAAHVKRLPGATADAVHVATFADGGGAVWCADWNVTGTVVASTGEDGKLRLRRANAAGRWDVVAVTDAAAAVAGSGPPAPAPAGGVGSSAPAAAAAGSSSSSGGILAPPPAFSYGAGGAVFGGGWAAPGSGASPFLFAPGGGGVGEGGAL
jgi:nucleoporin SEH1